MRLNTQWTSFSRWKWKKGVEEDGEGLSQGERRFHGLYEDSGADATTLRGSLCSASNVAFHKQRETCGNRNQACLQLYPLWSRWKVCQSPSKFVFFFLFLTHAFCGLFLRLPWNRSYSATWEIFQLCLALLVFTVFTAMDLFNSTMQRRTYIGLHFFIPWVSTDALQQILAPKSFTVHPSQQI